MYPDEDLWLCRGLRWPDDAGAVTGCLHATDALVTRADALDVPGLSVAITAPRDGTARVHLIGRLDATTATILTAGLAAVTDDPEVTDLVIDLSALTFVDRIGMGVLGVNRALLVTGGKVVRSAHPHGDDLRLLDCAARAGWAPPRLECTDILHWQPRLVQRTCRPGEASSTSTARPPTRQPRAPGRLGARPATQ